MKSNRLRKIGGFSERHILLSSFLCLLISSIFLGFFSVYTGTAGSFSLKGGIENIIFSAKWSIFGIWLWIIPVFFISLLFCSFLKKKSSYDASLSFFQKFILAFIPALATILLFSILIVRDIPRPYASNPMYLYSLSIFTSCLYSVLFASFFGWLSKLSRVGIIVRSSIVNLLMGSFLLFMHVLSKIGM